LIAGLLGALFAMCMLKSKGIVVPWFIHFCQNAVIYAFWAIGFVS
jgi:membrane protease YdiL (CAAX protease family)